MRNNSKMHNRFRFYYPRPDGGASTAREVLENPRRLRGSAALYNAAKVDEGENWRPDAPAQLIDVSLEALSLRALFSDGEICQAFLRRVRRTARQSEAYGLVEWSNGGAVSPPFLRNARKEPGGSGCDG